MQNSALARLLSPLFAPQLVAAEMSRHKSAPLESSLQMVANGMAWQQAFLANPGCGTWANFRRAAKAQEEA